MRMKQIRKWGMHVRKRRKLPNLNLGSPHLEVPRSYSLFLLWCQKQRRACCSAKEQQPVVQTTCCKNTIAMHSTFCMIMLILICKNPIKHLSVFFCWQRPHKCVVFLDVWKVSVVKRRKFFSWEEQMSVSVSCIWMEASGGTAHFCCGERVMWAHVAAISLFLSVLVLLPYLFVSCSFCETSSGLLGICGSTNEWLWRTKTSHSSFLPLLFIPLVHSNEGWWKWLCVLCSTAWPVELQKGMDVKTGQQWGGNVSFFFLLSQTSKTVCVIITSVCCQCWWFYGVKHTMCPFSLNEMLEWTNFPLLSSHDV